MILATSGILVINTVLLIIGILADIAAVLVLVLGALLGIRKGGMRAGWKLLWRVLSIAVAALITAAIGKIVTPVLSYTASKLSKAVLPKQIAPFVANSNITAGILVSAVLPFLFIIILILVLLLFLIPDVLIWNKVLEPACSKYRAEKPVNATVSRVLGAVLNAVAAVILFFAFIMPLACNAARASSLIKTAGREGVADIGLSSLSNPVYIACDAVMGRTVYTPLTSFGTAFGRTNLYAEANNAVLVYGSLTDNGDYEKDVRKANSAFRRSKLLPDLFCDILIDISNGDTDKYGSLGLFRDAIDSVQYTYKGVKKRDMRDDANALFSELVRLQASGFLSAKTGSARDAALSTLLSDDSLKGLCDDIYDSERTVEITEDVANSLYNSYIEKILNGSDISYTRNPFDLSHLSKKDAAREISGILSSLNNLNKFSDTLKSYNNAKKEGKTPSVSDIDLESLGKALDTMKGNESLAPCYDDLLNVAEKKLPSSGGSSSSNVDLSKLLDSAKEANSSGSYLGSAQGIAGLGETLSDKTLSESEKNDKLTKNVKTLMNNINSDTAEKIGEDISSVLQVEDNPKAVDFITEYTKQVAKDKEESAAETDLDAEKDAKAIAAIYALLEHSGDETFNVPDEELSGYIKDIVDSNTIAQTMDSYAKQGETLGLAESLSENNKDVIKKSLAASGAPEENIRAAMEFLKLS